MTKKTRGFGLAMKKMADGGMAGPVGQLATRGLQNKTGPIGMQPRDAGMMSPPDQASMSAPMSASMPGAGMAAQSIPAPQSFNAVPGSRTMKKGGTVKKMASGGRASSYNDMTGGAGGGIGRLEKTSIAAKTVSQKLKKGGKVKRMADGGLSAGDVYAMTGKYGAPADDMGRRDAAMKAYQARQDATEAAAKKRMAKPAVRPQTPPNSAGGPRGYMNDRLNEEGIDRENFMSRNADYAQRVQAANQAKSIRQGALSNDAPLPEFDNPMSRFSVRTLRDLGGNINENNMKRGGKVMKMAKGGKVKNFEGSAKDMAQDKKMAKARGMTLKEWEASSDDVKHDTKEGMKKGGMAKKMADGGSTDPYSNLAARKEKESSRKFPDFATAFFGPSIRDSADTRAKLRDIGRRTGLPDTRNQEDTEAGAMSRMKKGGKAEMHAKGCKCMACGGMAKYAKGGMAEDSPREQAMDKRQAKKSGMSMAKFEKSSKDVDKMAGGGISDLMAALAPMKPIVKSARSSGVMPMRTMSRPLGMRGNSRGPTMAPPSGEAMMAKGGKASFKKKTTGVRTVKNSTLTGADMKPDGKKPALRGLIEPKANKMMPPLGEKKGGKTKKMATGGKVRGAGIAQRGFGFKPGA